MIWDSTKKTRQAFLVAWWLLVPPPRCKYTTHKWHLFLHESGVIDLTWEIKWCSLFRVMLGSSHRIDKRTFLCNKITPLPHSPDIKTDCTSLHEIYSELASIWMESSSGVWQYWSKCTCTYCLWETRTKPYGQRTETNLCNHQLS